MDLLAEIADLRGVLRHGDLAPAIGHGLQDRDQGEYEEREGL